MRHVLTANDLVLGAAALALGLIVPLTRAGAVEEEAEVTISLKDHKFDPAELKVPASKAIKLTVKNLDTTPEEFESHPLGSAEGVGAVARPHVNMRRPRGPAA